ncbi:hypothetical protein [Legionella oakridgensis]|uniref:Uncharacterized protein n=2 Tax=Legionella oakridgensis TaxID=29423 RepID=W0BGT5_9GAMM|nr:hypothetical protein [Legionella oakridgensis]AHE67812.1 hypothetical protein Loa_02270 [Legionella oakridgensis ATCC 33761 = DSM 21215]ETO92616.1 hypothetical protein LOR_47c08080 [Legionella oakridgensis RV-2-2007]KTD44058.1 hypothetical protein Loak_0200 [Legionella oakridgensis]STY20826.1 Uncharacterised protein [Legionella longbeachae]
MDKQDEALTISNPRMLSAIYFSLLAIIATIAIDTIFYAMGVEQLLPIFKAIVLAVIIAACFGALFGKRIVYSKAPYKKHAFWWAFLMVMAALPIYTLGFLFFLHQHHADLFTGASFQDVLYMYFIVLIYSFILVGFWLALIAGLAAVYLRSYLVYYLLQSLNVRRKSPRESVIKNKTAKYGEATITPPKNNHH